MSDLRFAFRQLRKSPGFTAVAVVTLALGIGANTVVFSVARGVLLRPLGVEAPEQVVWIRGVDPAVGADAEFVSWPEFLDVRESAPAFESLGLFAWSGATWEQGDRAEERPTLHVTPGLADVLRVRPVLGRMLQPSDFEPSAEPVVLIGHHLWQTRFGGRADVLGQTLRLDDRTRAVVGVLPPGLEFPVGRVTAAGTGGGAPVPGERDFWLPLVVNGNDAVSRGARMFPAIGRLKPGTAPAVARAELAALSQRLAAEFPETNRGRTFQVVSLRDQALGRTRQGIHVLVAAVVAVLLVCCVNLASLMLARGTARRQELAVRAAMGAGRARVARGLLAEAAVLAVAGGCAGALLAAWAVPAIRAAAPPQVPFIGEIALDRAALAFTLALVPATALAFGLLPALRQSRVGAADALRSGARAGPGRDVRAWQRGLLAGQVALVLALLASAGLLLESFRRITGQDLGYRPANVVALDVGTRGFATNGDVCRLYRAIHARLSAMPGVQAVGTVSSAPLTGKWTFSEKADVVGRPLPEADRPSLAGTFVAFDYFQAMGVPLVHGRLFRAAELDDDGYGRVVIFNEAAAAALFPGSPAVGGRFTVGSNPDRVLEVVGVVRDTRDVRPEDRPQPRLYWHYAFGGAQVVVRTTTPARSVVPALRDAVAQFGAGVSVREARPMTEVVSAAVAERRFLTGMLSAYAAVALAIAAVGVFGVVAYQASHRTREFGVRAAFGATPATLARLVLAQAAAVVGAGVGLGIPLALGSGRLLSAHLFDLSPHDPSVMAAVCLLVFLAGLGAGLLPALRAARVDPMHALRCD